MAFCSLFLCHHRHHVYIIPGIQQGLCWVLRGFCVGFGGCVGVGCFPGCFFVISEGFGGVSLIYRVFFVGIPCIFRGLS